MPPSTELLRIVQDPATQQLYLYLLGQPARVDDITDVQLRAHLLAVLQRLQSQPSSAPAPPDSPPEPLPPLSQSTPAAPPFVPTPADETPAPFLARLRDSLKPGYKAPPLIPAKPAAKDAAATPTADMFAQIDRILQRRLREQAYTTPLEIIGEGGELHIKYASQVYLQVDAVPDERARALIHDAVKEWEET